ncbi:MAG: CD1375 family protein [Duncaniella sp.]|nr:CD1375 family protein [Duncaniella sp.]
MAIVNVYVSLIKKGVKTLDDVPLRIWEQVKAALEEADGK